MKILLLALAVMFMTACGGGGGDSSTPANNDTPAPTPAPTPTPTLEASILPGPFLNIDDEVIAELEIIDINNDGLQDVLMSATNYSSNNTFKVLVNQGEKVFVDQTANLFPAGSNPTQNNLPYWVSQFYFVDLNNDGMKDLVAGASNPQTGSFDQIFIQQADGTFDELPTSTFAPFDFTYNNGEYDPGHGLDGMLLPVDVDGDGDVDLVNLDNSHSVLYDNDLATTDTIFEVRVYRNDSLNGATIFTKSSEARYQDINPEKAAFVDNPAVVDINHDGFDDIVYFGPKWKGSFVNEAVELKVLLSNGMGSFTSGAAQVISGEIPTLIHGNAHSVGDFNSDGYVDIVVGGSGYDAAPFDGERNVLLLSQPDGKYTDAKQQASAFIDNPIMTHSSAVGDLDGDGSLDIVFADIAKGTVADHVKLLLNDGNANFQIQADAFPNGASYGDEAEGNAWTSVRIADMDNDGRADIILGAQFTTTNSIIYWNDGSGTFK
ncbi:hypothetical protein FLM48_03805 [Shewanella sp. Scap07]|uniref:FG-GAP repeat domain-containing protein n=1 Tax=Shewanella sp. Scap07 TaxID=2589987 RepID=UPI0015B838A0|nr:VCBS repeat-containing protein [Shewanella sp. Scap07]QLE84289.1 hypothetical protein FLM48_03805 [Shewanella sp. Scap07]